MVRIILQFSAKWEILVILGLFFLLPILFMRVFSSSWKRPIFFDKELGLKRNISGVSAFVGTLFCLLLVINFSGLIPFSFARRRQGWFRIVFRTRFFVVRLIIFFRGKIAFVNSFGTYRFACRFGFDFILDGDYFNFNSSFDFSFTALC